MRNTRHRKDVYQSDCYCPDCECQREAIALGGDMSRALAKKPAIRVGDKFKIGTHIMEVIGTKPGGKVELFDREKSMFTDMYHKNIDESDRIKPHPNA